MARHMFPVVLFLCRVFRPSNMFWEQLEPVPIEVGIGLHSWTIKRQGNQCMCLERNGMKITCKRLPIDIDLPTFRLIEFAWIAQLREPSCPDVEEVPEGEGTSTGSLNVYDPIVRMRVQPVEARPFGRNAGIRRSWHRFPINVDGQMCMNVKSSLFQLITRDGIYGRIGSVRRGLALSTSEIHEEGGS